MLVTVHLTRKPYGRYLATVGSMRPARCVVHPEHPVMRGHGRSEAVLTSRTGRECARYQVV
jgi:hypothetical protein